jgi:spore coat protein U-like protein
MFALNPHLRAEDDNGKGRLGAQFMKQGSIRFCLAVSTALAAAWPFMSMAQQTDTAQFQVKIVILESCNITTSAASDVDFLTHLRGADAPVDASGTLTINCTLDTPYNVGLNAGLSSTSPTPSADNRRMTNGTAFVPYGLYRDAARQLLWGETIGTETLSGVGTAADVDVPVYGRVPSTDYPPGTYTDTVVATVTY